MPLGPELIALLQIVVIDVSLAGDNAIAVGVAAAGLPPVGRHHAVFAGIIAATFLRILFALFAIQLLHITGLLAAGGLLLIWIAWKMVHDIHHARLVEHGADSESLPVSQVHPAKTFSNAILQIIIADISMSLDNVLAVAGIARDHLIVLITGLVLSVLLMGVAAAFVAKLTTRHKWIGWLGVAIVLYTALRMLAEGGQDILHSLT